MLISNRKRNHWIAIVCILFIVYLIFVLKTNSVVVSASIRRFFMSRQEVENEQLHALADTLAAHSPYFDNFNNQTGVNHWIIPNIIHFIRFNTKEYSFTEYICLKAAFRNHRPDFFYIHTNLNDFKGKYWELIKKDPDLSERIRVVPTEVPSEIFGQKLSKRWKLWHGSDIARIKIMMQYGGIYLDNDVFVIKNLDK